MGATKMEFVQVPSPQVNLPEGAQSRRRSPNPPSCCWACRPRMRSAWPTSIDWTTTLVIPLPAECAHEPARSRSMGVTGLLMEGVNDEAGGESALVWEKDGILYVLNGRVDRESSDRRGGFAAVGDGFAGRGMTGDARE